MPTRTIRIAIPKIVEEIVERRRSEFDSLYLLTKYAFVALDILFALGFKWYHLAVLHYILSSETAFSGYREGLEEQLGAVRDFVDSLVQEMASDNFDDLRLFFTPDEWRRVRKIVGFAKGSEG